MRENRTYGSVRGGQSNLIPSTRLTALRAEGCGGALTGDEYKVSVTDSPFSVIWHDKRYGNQPPPVAFPPLVPYGPKGGNAGVVHEVYDSLFFSSNSLFPLEGKCHVVAKGCTGQSTEVTLHHYPDRQSAASLATSWSSPPLQAGGTRFDKCSCKGFFIRGRLL